MNSFFCSSVPHCKMWADQGVAEEVGTQGSAGRRTLVQDDLLEEAQALAAVSGGQLAQIQPPSNSLAVQDSWNSLRCSGVISNPGSPIRREFSSATPDLLAERLGFGDRSIHAPG